MIINFKKFFKKMDFNKKDLKAYALFLLLTIMIFSILRYGQSLLNIMTPLAIAIFLIVFLIIWFMAGIAVVKSLFVVSAGLSLVIFLAQSYCGLPSSSQTADGSFQSLVWFALIYIGLNFIRSLYKEIFGDDKNKGSLATFKKINDNKHLRLLLILYAIFIAMFLLQLWQVINPIISNFCIYN